MKRRSFKIFLTGVCFLGLSGCFEESAKKEDSRGLNRLHVESKISKALHTMPLSEEIIQEEATEKNKKEKNEQDAVDFQEPEEPRDFFPENSPNFHFPSVQPEFIKRHQALCARETISSLMEKSIFSKVSISKDTNYKTHLKGIKEDISSFPISGDRVITADRYIPVVLENSINSQLPGRFIVIVETHVFANEGRGVIFPKGTRIICTYKSLVKEGDSRLYAACSRAIRPDGASVFLTEAYAADQMARTGVPGNVDNRIWEKYGASFLVAGISALASAGSNVAPTSALRQSASNLSHDFGKMTTEVLKQHIDLSPVMTVASGSRLQIIPMTDIWLRALEEREEENYVEQSLHD